MVSTRDDKENVPMDVDRNVQRPTQRSKGRKRSRDCVQQQTPVKEPSDDQQKQDEGTQRKSKRSQEQVNYQEKGMKSVRLNANQVDAKLAKEVETENMGLKHLTTLNESSKGVTPTYRLADFTIFTGDDEHVYLGYHACDRLKAYIKGTIGLKDSGLNGENSVKVDKIGPIKSWRLDFKNSKVLVQTAKQEYQLLERPSASFRATHALFMEQVKIAFEVFKGLHSGMGGDPTKDVYHMQADIARSQVATNYRTGMDALLANREFLYRQGDTLRKQAALAAPALLDVPFFATLKQQELPIYHQNVGILIGEQLEEADAQRAAAPEVGTRDAADQELGRHMERLQDVKDAQRQAGRRVDPNRIYVQIAEEEIAHDYPEPRQYTTHEDETDELMLVQTDPDTVGDDPDTWPLLTLTDFAIYNGEGFLSTLELLPMFRGVDPDIRLYGSGIAQYVPEFSDDMVGAHPVSQTAHQSDAQGGGGSGSGGSNEAAAPGEELDGCRVFLSQIKEWWVEVTAEHVFITMRTDAARYRLVRPQAAYAPWFNKVLKCTRVAMRLLSILDQAKRASRVSLDNAVDHLIKLDPEDLAFVSAKAREVERFLTVHGQVVLNQLRLFPKKEVSDSALVVAIQQKMQIRKHSKLDMPKKGKRRVKQVTNANPMRNRAQSKPEGMPATATRMVYDLWQAMFPPRAEPEDEQAPEEDQLLDEERRDQAGAPEEASGEQLADDAVRQLLVVDAGSRDKLLKRKVALSDPISEKGSTHTFRTVSVGKTTFRLGDTILLIRQKEAECGHYTLGIIHALYQASKGKPQVQARVLMPGEQTLLGTTASKSELFLTNDFIQEKAECIAAKFNAKRLALPWGVENRNANARELAKFDQKFAAEGKLEEREFYWRFLYQPEMGMFTTAPKDLGLGVVKEDAGDEGVAVLRNAGRSFRLGGNEYRVNGFVYLDSNALPVGKASSLKKWDDSDAKDMKSHKGGANQRLKPFVVVQIESIVPDVEGRQVKSLQVRRYYRPEEVTKPEKPPHFSFWELYRGQSVVSVDPLHVVRSCRVVHGPNAQSLLVDYGPSMDEEGRDTFVCFKGWDGAKRKHVELPQDVLYTEQGAARPKKDKHVEGSGKQDRGKGSKPVQAIKKLATLDIFAGCGGLSEGLHQAGVAESKWAIEYDKEASEAYKLNHPDVAVMNLNCNVVLARAMMDANMADDCQAHEKALEGARKLSDEQVACIPEPGSVDFIVGGPPCQGFSGMNRFNNRDWSLQQNSMVMAFLAYADFYRPRYFMLENVRAFVSHNKSRTFHVTVRTLLHMGYQVRFGVLNAGNFGVPQSRSRTIIFAAAPSESLPDWPHARHVFHQPQVSIKLPNNLQYCAAPADRGAPLRSLTVADAITDLPAIENGAAADKLAYRCASESAYQRYIRGGCQHVHQHVCKKMNDLNLRRCSFIPKETPGADWRVLKELVEKDPSLEKFQGEPLVPWCLPNTAARHNNWRGLFGRLDPDGYFPTSTTDPQPMGKVGQVFHPTQDRIVSVRECARAQGFPDRFRFCGNINNMHRQIGNAVPPPLAHALGLQLLRVMQPGSSSQPPPQIGLFEHLGKSTLV